ncbi:hypothetical protein ACQP1U_01535 [Actinomycetota bacterium]
MAPRERSSFPLRAWLLSALPVVLAAVLLADRGAPVLATASPLLLFAAIAALAVTVVTASVQDRAPVPVRVRAKVRRRQAPLAHRIDVPAQPARPRAPGCR